MSPYDSSNEITKQSQILFMKTSRLSAKGSNLLSLDVNVKANPPS